MRLDRSRHGISLEPAPGLSGPLDREAPPARPVGAVYLRAVAQVCEVLLQHRAQAVIVDVGEVLQDAVGIEYRHRAREVAAILLSRRIGLLLRVGLTLQPP